MSSVRLENINKKFDDFLAVKDLSIHVKDGEFFSLLGPSGCGKTTTLRMIAGFETPSSGRILFEQRDVSHLRTQDRNVGMVFQNYALFPHMTVNGNVAFGLNARKVEKKDCVRRVKDALALVGLNGLGDRLVSALSGGQQQRVALARALVIEPDILLLDEPLSNLDAKLRVETREHIRSLQQRLGITTFYVTHDQDEALSQSDRLAVLIDGECAQIGTPFEVYHTPLNKNVMDFLGRAHFIAATLESAPNDRLAVRLSDSWIQTVDPHIPDMKVGSEVVCAFRPHEVEISGEETDDMPRARILDIIYTGAQEEIILQHNNHKFSAVRYCNNGINIYRKDQVVSFKIRSGAARIFPGD